MAVSGALIDAWETDMLDYLFTVNAAAAPADYFISLHTGDPGDTGAATSEVADLYSYARQDVSATLTETTGTLSLSGDKTFPAASGGNWGTITHWALCVSGTHGTADVICRGDLSTSRTINDGDTFTFTGASMVVDFSVSDQAVFANGKTLAMKWLGSNATAITAGTRPTAWYMSLWTSDPLDAESGTEVSGGSYARQQLTGGTALTVSGDTVSFSGDVTFPEATANWGTLTHFAIHSAASSTGNGLMHGPLGSSVVIDDGDTFQFTASGSSITLG